MKIGLYYCHCGMDDLASLRLEDDDCPLEEAGSRVGQPGVIDVAELERRLLSGGQASPFAYFQRIEFACSEEGCVALQRHLEEQRPDRVVMTVCSIREQEDSMRAVMARAGLNPYMLQLVNVREHVAWVTEGNQEATDKAARYLRAAARRVALHEPLQSTEINLNNDILVIGAGPAGIKAALTLAEAGRGVTLVEASPILGGVPVRIEDLFPNMDCGPCLLDPLLGEVLHGPVSNKIELLLNSEVTEVSGFFGHFHISVTRKPRYVSVTSCIGCGMCIEACPSSLPSRINLGRTQRKAIDVEFMGGLPNAPFIERDSCLHFSANDQCSACLDICPVPDTIHFQEQEEVIERSVGAIIVAVGGALYDCSRLPNLGYGKLADVYTSFEIERVLAANGPTEGQLVTRAGHPVRSVAIVHCVGSLDANHRPYCSGICCLGAFKINHLVDKKMPQARITHFYKTIVAAGKQEYATYARCLSQTNTDFVLYQDIDQLRVVPRNEGLELAWTAVDGTTQRTIFDIVVLMPAMIPSPSTSKLAKTLDLKTDSQGFLEELHGRTEASRSGVRGIYLAGTCQSPMDLQRAVTGGLAAAGHALSALVPGRTLVVSPVVARVDEARCSSCWTCIPVCPFKAIERQDNKARVNPVLCLGCGTCVAACPAGVIAGDHFTNAEIFAEIEELLA